MAGSMIGFLPLLGWNTRSEENGCYFLKVMDHNYLVFLYFGTIITPALILMAFYAHIYRVILKQLRNIVTMNPENGTSITGSTTGGTMLRVFGAQQKREVKATQNLSIIVLFFMICWIPLYTINCIIAFCPTCKISTAIMNPFIILSHLNSACNPLLYAYHLKDFRAALKHLLYNIFRINHPVPLNYNGRPSIASNNAFTNSIYYKSVKEGRNSSSILKNNSNHIRSLPYNYPASLNKSKISSIVPKSVTLAAATASTGDHKMEISRISEIPSGDSDFENKITPFKDSESDRSAIINAAFIDDSNFDIVSDDVFLDDLCPITNIHSETNIVSGNANRFSEISVIPTFKKKMQDSLYSSSPQLSRNVFVVETDLMKHDKQRKFVRSFSEVENDIKTSKRALKFSLSGEFIYSPTKSIKLSPFRGIENYLLNKNLETSSDESVSLKSSKDRSNGSIYHFDNHSFKR